MRKKRRIIILSIVILLVIAIIAIVFIINKNKPQEKLLPKIYDELNTSDSYSFDMEANDSNKTIMSKKGEQTAIDQYNNNDHTTTLIKDGNTYLILHQREEYYVYLRNNIEQNILTDGLKEVVEKDCVFGTEKIKGKKYTYEEYDGSTIFMVSNNLPLDEQGVKTRFYFNSNKQLSYIKTIFGDNEELIKVTITKDVSDEIFEIPSNYAEN